MLYTGLTFSRNLRKQLPVRNLMTPSSKNQLSEKIDQVFSIDLRALALLRISLASLLIVDLWQRIPLTSFFFAPGNVYPFELSRLHRSLPLSVHMVSDALWFHYMLTALAVVVATALLVGWKSKLMSGASWYLLMSLHMDSPGLQNAGDDLLRLLLLWGIFLPMGACWSLDSRATSEPSGNRVCSIASAGMLLQVFFVFQIAGLAKLHGDTWVSGRAVEIVMHDLLFARPLALYLQQFPELLKLLTYGTLGIEVFAPFLLFWPGKKRVRALGLFLLLGLSLSLGLCIELGLIPFVLFVSFLPFLPSSAFARFLTLPDAVLQRKERRKSKFLLLTIAHAFFHKLLPAALLLFIVLAAYHSVQPLYLMPSKVYRVGKAFMIRQDWWMYAPNPGVGPLSVTLVGETAHGEDVKIVIGIENQVVPELPELNLFWTDFRARTFLFNRMINPIRRPETVFFLSRVCRDWNTRSPDDALTKVSLKLNSPATNVPKVATTYAAYRCGSRLTLEEAAYQ
jgi:hypothetical protein